MVARPVASVVIPVFNSKDVAVDAVQSILDQTVRDIEVIVVDDGSADDVASHLLQQVCGDARLKVVQHRINKGVAVARNTGIAAANGDYIAFLDADDIAVPERIERQIQFLEQNADVGVVGSAVTLFGDETGSISPLCRPSEVAASTMFSCEFLMPTLMARRSVLSNLGHLFIQDYGPNCDWEIVARLVRETDVANMPDHLVKYRRWGSQMTSSIIDTIDCAATRLRSEMLEWVGVPRSDQDLAAHVAVSPCYWLLERRLEETISYDRALNWLERVRQANAISQRLDSAGLNLIIERCVATFASSRSNTPLMIQR